MKRTIFSIVTTAVVLASCGDSNNDANESNKTGDTLGTSATATNNTPSQNTPVDETVTAYLQIKNALAADNGNEAASAGRRLHEAMQALDNATLTTAQKKVYDDVKDDIKEHAEHIGSNAEKIAHQREHFDMLSEDMIDLVKAVKPSQVLYRDHCPMYNDNKGADWLSEVKEIKNPYLGKKMPTCGEVKEEIR